MRGEVHILVYCPIDTLQWGSTHSAMANSNMYRLIFLSKEDNLQVHRPDGFEHQKTNIFCNRFAIFRICILYNPTHSNNISTFSNNNPVQRGEFAGALP